MKTREGVRRLRFGTAYRVDASVGLRAEIEELLGQPPIARLHRPRTGAASLGRPN